MSGSIIIESHLLPVNCPWSYLTVPPEVLAEEEN